MSVLASHDPVSESSVTDREESLELLTQRPGTSRTSGRMISVINYFMKIFNSISLLQVCQFVRCIHDHRCKSSSILKFNNINKIDLLYFKSKMFHTQGQDRLDQEEEIGIAEDSPFFADAEKIAGEMAMNKFLEMG